MSYQLAHGQLVLKERKLKKMVRKILDNRIEAGRYVIIEGLILTKEFPLAGNI